jgi:hypothetical protein
MSLKIKGFQNTKKGKIELISKVKSLKIIG